MEARLSGMKKTSSIAMQHEIRHMRLNAMICGFARPEDVRIRAAFPAPFRNDGEKRTGWKSSGPEPQDAASARLATTNPDVRVHLRAASMLRVCA